MFIKTTYYQESPFMKQHTTIEEINQEWQHVREENIQNKINNVNYFFLNVLIKILPF